jgi:diadenosine tetraphosphate (Ap4A) HIT family hydrolase
MATVSRSVQAVTGAVKLNYEIHGNTIPHLHIHVYPRFVGDPFEGGPIDPRGATSFHRGPEDLAVLKEAISRGIVR